MIQNIDVKSAPYRPLLNTRGKLSESGNSDAMVNCFPFDIRRLTGNGPFDFPEAGDDGNDADND